MATRRQFLQYSALAGAGLALAERFAFPNLAWAFYQSPGTPLPGSSWPGMAKYATTLRGVGPGGIPVAASDGAAITGAVHYSLNITEFTDQLHPVLNPTTLWGYNPTVALGGGIQPQRHLGGIIVAKKGTPVQLTFTNKLPPIHTLPVDVSTPALGGFADAAARFGGSGENAVTTHLHGGFVPWVSDGGPYSWFTPGGIAGPSYMGSFMKSINPNLRPGQEELYYPNQQSARLMWYHDHAHDITRLNAYAGIATAYIIRDTFEGNLRNQGLPDFVENGGREIPLVVQDKIFVGPNIATLDPTWMTVTSPKSQTIGSLWYPHVYEKNRWKFTGSAVMPDPSCIPEAFGDTILMNGTVFPQATVEARRYRFRLLNACNARFLNLQTYIADTSPDGLSYNNKGVPLNAAGPGFLVLGTEGGFLPKPVKVPAVNPFNPAMLTNGLPSMLTAPAERWDFMIDFSGLAGKSVILYTDAPAPFPTGDARNDYYAASGNVVSTKPGYGPDTRIMMRFNVVAATSPDPSLSITTSTDLTGGLDPFLVPPGVAVQNGVLNLPPGVPVRQLTLNEDFDSLGRLIQRMGTNVSIYPGTFGRNYDDAATESPQAGSTEVWQIANTTGDTHPIHFHLVNVQILGRQPFDVGKYAGTPIYTGPARNPDPTELGWKETVRMNPGEVTTVIMQFNLPSVPFVYPNSPRTGGKEYVYHCHILEHEEHDMMRPLVVI
jgi:FtsP/CotA-like multicopper oxidase with cupredoxin domain